MAVVMYTYTYKQFEEQCHIVPYLVTSQMTAVISLALKKSGTYASYFKHTSHTIFTIFEGKQIGLLLTFYK